MTRDFYTGFKTLTGNAPFPWQAIRDIPTGLGKTPVFKTRGQCRIKRTELDQGIDGQPRGGDGGGRGE